MGLYTEKFKIYTYCTDINNLVFQKLSSRLEIELLPILTTWSWDFYPKSLSIYETLKNIDKETIVLICDSYDVLPVKYITNEKLFEHIKNNFDLNKITFNAEKNCYPDLNLKPLYPEVNSEWKYLNGGIYVGKAKNILFMLENLLNKIKGYDEQAVFSMSYINKEFNIDIDYNCKVFQTLYMLNNEDLTIKEGKIFNNKTKTFPLLIHGNGISPSENFKNEFLFNIINTIDQNS